MQTLGEIKERVQDYVAKFGALRSEIARVIVGQQEIVEGVLLALMAGGHVLLEGVPGLGKTLLVRTLGETMGLDFARVQFTPDLMPSDIVGTNIIVEDETGEKMFRFQPGPVFTNLLLADEVNRATPKTQSALLEAMQERQVTVGGTTYPLDGVFFVLATQNPLEMEGTYPLPEAQLDRFFFKLAVQSPTVDELAEILARTTGATQPAVTPRFGADVVRSMVALIRQVKIADETTRLALRIIRATHPDADEAPAPVKKYVRYGASPRGAQAIVLGAKALALLSGRYHASTDDVLRVAVPALNHRLILNFHGEMEHAAPAALIGHVLDAVLQR